MKKLWHHYQTWEDYKAGMWRTLSGTEREEYLEIAIDFTGNAELYGSWMLKVIDEWPIACEQNLTDTGMNRKAWVGHAACCLATGCPEDITRSAWGELSQEQQDAANLKAEQAITIWEQRHERKDSSVDREVEESGIPERTAG